MGGFMLNSYICPKCKHQWSVTWTSTNNDDCSECSERAITPFYSIELNSDSGSIQDPQGSLRTLVGKLNYVYNQLQLALDMGGYLEKDSLVESSRNCQEILELLKAFGMIEVDSRLLKAFE